jgi:hypothetical protein
MTREEREKALYALRKSTPIMAMTPNEFDDYIKTLNKIADWLEQEPCDDSISRTEAMTEIMMFAGNVKPDEEDIYIKVSDAVQLLRELPPVTPKPKTDTWSIKEVADALEKHGLMMSEISETEIKSMTKEQNYMRGYADGKSDVLDKIKAEIERERSFQRAMDEYDIATGLRKALEIIDKYTAESEEV